MANGMVSNGLLEVHICQYCYLFSIMLLPPSLHIALNLITIIVADLVGYSKLQPQFVFSEYNYNFCPYFLEE